MRLMYIYLGENKEPHPYHVKSTWKPPIQQSVALESYLEQVKRDEDNYRPLASPIVIETNHKVKQLIKIPCSTQWCRGNFTYAIPWRSIPLWLLLNQRSAVVSDKQV